MKDKMQKLLLILLPILLWSCSSQIEIYSQPNTKIDKDKAIIIFGQDTGRLGVNSKIEHMLLSKGLNILSVHSVKDVTKLEDRIVGDNEFNNQYMGDMINKGLIIQWK